MTSPLPAQADRRVRLAPAPALLHAALDATTEAVVLCTDTHEVLLVNTAAELLVPELRPGMDATAGPVPELARAITDGDDAFTAIHGGRQIRGVRRALGDEHYGWYLQDVTPLERERARTTFLAEAGRRLASSLHQRLCLRTTAELAVSHLADAAVVVLPSVRRQSEWMRLVGATLKSPATTTGPAATSASSAVRRA
ncbi:hypothetical protein AB0M20_19090, partial [Actinoplanes sp. NPDC051633]